MVHRMAKALTYEAALVGQTFAQHKMIVLNLLSARANYTRQVMPTEPELTDYIRAQITQCVHAIIGLSWVTSKMSPAVALTLMAEVKEYG